MKSVIQLRGSVRFRNCSILCLTAVCGFLLLNTQAAMGQVQDQCYTALPFNPSVNGPVTGCGAVITVLTVNHDTGQATSFTVTATGNGNPYDGEEDTLVGVQNNSGDYLKSIDLSSTDTTDHGIFFFDADGPCNPAFHPAEWAPYTWCTNPYSDPNGYQGPHNTFTVVPGVYTSGTVNFDFPPGYTGIPPGGSTWFALEGTPQSIGGQTVTMQLSPGETDFQFDTPGAMTIQKIVYTNSGTDPSGTTMKVTFLPISDTAFQNLVANKFEGGHCMQQDTGNGNFSCAVTIALCSTTPNDPTSFQGHNCPQGSTGLIGVIIKYLTTSNIINPSQVINPGYLAATDNALSCNGPTDTGNSCRDVHNIFTGIAEDCCTTSGGTKSFNSLFVPVSDLLNPTYAFTGFFQPVDNLPIVNVVKAGSAVPVKFSLGGNFGLNIFSGGAPGSGTITCNVNAPADTIETTVAAGNSSLSYDPTSNQYTYVWKTLSSWAGTCRQLVLNFNDGSTPTKRANFQFKK